MRGSDITKFVDAIFIRLSLLIIFVVITFSCKTNSENILEIDPSGFEENKLTLSDIADDIKYIPIDNYYPIGFISFVKLSSKSLYIFEPRYGLLKYNREGKNGKRIGDFGRGPGQYTRLLSFAIDDKNESLYILNSVRKIDVYSSTGKYIRSLPLQNYKGNFQEIDVLNSNIFISEYINAGAARYNWIVIDSLGVLQSSKKNSMPSFITGMVGGGGLFKHGNSIYYWNIYNDTVFKVLPDLSYMATILIKPGKSKIPKSLFGEEQYNKFFIPYKLFETNKFIMLNYAFHQKIRIALVDKKSKISYSSFIQIEKDTRVPSYRGGIQNNLDGGLDFIPVNYFEENGKEYLIGYLNSIQLNKHLLSDEFKNSIPVYPDKKRTLINLGKALIDTDNPVIIMVKLKTQKNEDTN